MQREQIIRAWKDEDYRLSLSRTELSALPEHPAGLIELSDDTLAEVNGRTTNVLVGALVSLATIALTNYATCYRCGSTFDGGTCGMATAGCC